MGLDSIEIVVEVEKTFGISIADSEAEQIRTVGDFYEVVWAHIKHKRAADCTSQALFYKLRRVLEASFVIPPGSIKPGTDLDAIVPKINRRRLWTKLAEDAKLKFPQLVLTGTLSIIVGVFYLTVLICCIAYLAFHWRHLTTWLLMVVYFAVFGFVNKALAPLRTAFPTKAMKDLAYEVLRLNLPQLSKEGITRREMEQVMNAVFADKIGVALEEIKAHKSFTNDLGVD